MEKRLQNFTNVETAGTDNKRRIGNAIEFLKLDKNLQFHPLWSNYSMVKTAIKIYKNERYWTV